MAELKKRGKRPDSRLTPAELYERKIKRATQKVGTYRPEFDPLIETLAYTLTVRDDARLRFKMLGGETVVMHTNKRGAANLVTNPALAVIQKLNAERLEMWRELGLTPKALRRMSAEMEQKEDDPLADVLKIIRFDA